MAFFRFVLVASAVAGAAAFAPGVSVMPRASGQGAVGLCMNAGSGKIKQVAAFRGAGAGRAGKSLVPTDPASIDLDLVYGTKVVKDTVGGVDTTYQKPASSFFSFAAPAKRAAPKPAARVVAKPAARVVAKPAARVVAKPAARVVAKPAARVVAQPAARPVAAPVQRGGLRAAPAPAARAVAKPAARVAAKPAARLAPAAKPAAKPAAAAKPQRGGLRTMR